MSRLYFVVESDARERATGIRANFNGFLSAKWGSRSNSQDLLAIRINWEKGEGAPTVTLQNLDRRAKFEGFEKATTRPDIVRDLEEMGLITIWDDRHWSLNRVTLARNRK